MLRTILLSSAAVVALTSASFAADLPSRKAPAMAPYVAVPIFTWTGFYVGGDVGGAWTNDSVKTTVGGVPYLNTFKENASGVVGGLFAGYNWQTGANIVLGVEGDIEATSLNAKTTTFTTAAGALIPAGNILASESLPWQGSVRARVGYAAGNALFYVTGGLAVAQINTKYTTLNTNTFELIPGSNSFSSTQAGWTLGGGIEYAFNPSWTLRAEYRYANFGGFKDNITQPGGAWDGVSAKHQVTENTVRVGIAYKFGAPAAAVVAKY